MDTGQWLLRGLGHWWSFGDGVIVPWLGRRMPCPEAADYTDKTMHPVIQDFQRFIEDDPIVYMAFHRMFEQIPTHAPYDKDPVGRPQVKHVDVHMSAAGLMMR